MPATSPSRVLPRSARLLVVLVLAALLPATAPAIAAPATPTFGATIDPYARYEGQTQCLSVEQPGVQTFRALLQRTYGANGGGILRACDVGGRSEHKEGRAYDWMLNANVASDKAKADDFLRWLLATDAHGNPHAMARRLGVMYVIWNRQVWSAYRAADGWQPYAGASPHTDHIHVSFSWAGAKAQTSFVAASSPLTTPTSPTPAPDSPTTTPIATPIASDGPFDDVAGSHPMVDEIRWVADEDIAEGFDDGTFRPARSVTRAQMTVFVWRTVGEPKIEGSEKRELGISETHVDTFYEPALRWAASASVVPADRFAPSDAVSRAEMALLLHRAAGSPAPRGRHTFADVTADGELSRAVAWLAENGIARGTGPARFSPTARVTRAQTAAFLFRLVDATDG